MFKQVSKRSDSSEPLNLSTRSARVDVSTFSGADNWGFLGRNSGEGRCPLRAEGRIASLDLVNWKQNSAHMIFGARAPKTYVGEPDDGCGYTDEPVAPSTLTCRVGLHELYKQYSQASSCVTWRTAYPKRKP